MAHPFQAHRQTKVEHERVKHIAKGYAAGGAVSASEGAGAPAKRAAGGAVKIPIAGRKNGGRLDRVARRAEGGKVKPLPTKPGTSQWLEGRVRPDRPGRDAAYETLAKDIAGGKATGGAVKRASGGRTNGKKATTNVNVIIAPQGGDKMPGLAGPMPPVGGPPPVPPKPAMPPMMPAPGGGMAPPGMGGPPPGIRHSGGRAYKNGGGVKSGPAWDEGRKAGTQVSHSGNKMDGKDIGRGKPVTYASGGPIDAPIKGGMGPKLSGGARGGIGRLEKAARAAA